MKKFSFMYDWFIGICFFLVGMEATFSSSGPAGFFYLLAATMFLPPLYNWAGKYIHIFKSKNARIILAICFLLLGILTSPRPKAIQNTHFNATPTMTHSPASTR